MYFYYSFKSRHLLLHLTAGHSYAICSNFGGMTLKLLFAFQKVTRESGGNKKTLSFNEYSKTYSLLFSLMCIPSTQS